MSASISPGSGRHRMSAPVLLENKTFDELAVGASVALTRTLTRADLAVFSAAAGMDSGAGEGENGDGRWASEIGQWTLAFLTSLVATRLPGPGTAVLSQAVTFTRPAKVGDAVTAKVTVRGKERDGSSVRIEGECSNQDGT